MKGVIGSRGAIVPHEVNSGVTVPCRYEPGAPRGTHARSTLLTIHSGFVIAQDQLTRQTPAGTMLER